MAVFNFTAIAVKCNDDTCNSRGLSIIGTKIISQTQKWQARGFNLIQSCFTGALGQVNVDEIYWSQINIIHQKFKQWSAYTKLKSESRERTMNKHIGLISSLHLFCNVAHTPPPSQPCMAPPPMSFGSSIIWSKPFSYYV